MYEFITCHYVFVCSGCIPTRHPNTQFHIERLTTETSCYCKTLSTQMTTNIQFHANWSPSASKIQRKLQILVLLHAWVFRSGMATAAEYASEVVACDFSFMCLCSATSRLSTLGGTNNTKNQGHVSSLAFPCTEGVVSLTEVRCYQFACLQSWHSECKKNIILARELR